jgi:hypothetical protein
LDEDYSMEIVDGIPSPVHTQGNICGASLQKSCVEVVLDVGGRGREWGKVHRGLSVTRTTSGETVDLEGREPDITGGGGGGGGTTNR